MCWNYFALNGDPVTGLNGLSTSCSSSLQNDPLYTSSHYNTSLFSSAYKSQSVLTYRYFSIVVFVQTGFCANKPELSPATVLQQRVSPRSLMYEYQ